MKQEKHSLQQSLIESEADTEEDKTAQTPKKKKDYFQRLPTINGTNCISTLLFGWLYPFAAYGWKTTVKVDAMPTLPTAIKNENQFPKIKECFDNTPRSKRQGFTLMKVLAKTYLCEFLGILACLFIFVTIQSANPYVTSLIMRYISNKEDYPDYYGWLMFLVIIFMQTLKSLSDAQMGFRFTRLGVNMTNSLTLLIYSKSLRYQTIAQKEFTESDIINYSQVDAQRMSSGGFEIAGVLVAPLQIIVGLSMMHHFIGISFLSGVGIMTITILCTYFLQKRSYKLNRQILKKKDQRMKVTQQMLDIIRYIKINSIEKFFYKKIDEKRKAQVELYKKKGLMDVLTTFIFWSACPMILSGTFITYVLLGNQMNSEVAFTTIMIFSTLQYPLRLLPTSISSVVQMLTSIKRIERFLYADQIKTEQFIEKKDNNEQQAIVIDRGTFYYGVQKLDDNNANEKNIKPSTLKQPVFGSDSSRMKQPNTNLKNYLNQDPKQALIEYPSSVDSQNSIVQNQDYTAVLKDVNTSIKKGSFTMILGDIGSGKTSFLLAILNEMLSDKDARVTVNGRIAYAAQKAWIMSGSVKDNITFLSPYDENKFKKVLHFASLEQDIKILPHGVDTQIGEKGINISGGQKARIGLARALYSDRDIYFLDDVLSAVDVHVGEYLMRQTLKGYLKGKTILMPTHAIKFAEFVDEIIILEKGKIVRKGSYKSICQTPQFMKLFLEADSKDKQLQGDQDIEEVSEEDDDELEIDYSSAGWALNSTKKSFRQTPKASFRNITKKSFKASFHKPPEPEKKQQDKPKALIQRLIIPEDQQVGNVNLSVFDKYIKLNGGYCKFAAVVLFAMLMWISFTIASLMVMKFWCEDPVNKSYFIYYYVGFSVAASFFTFIRAYKLILAGAEQGQKVHRKVIKALLYASLGDFFNRVPFGRIINRLTKDMRELDEVMGYKVGNLLVNSFNLLGNLAICAYSSTPLIFIPIAVVAYVCFKFRLYYMKTQIEVARFEKSTNSPIVTGFISTISGLSSIRAYRMTKQFTDKQMKNLNTNKRVRITKAGMDSWFSINLTYLSFFINMGSIGYCLLSSNTNASLAGLLMSYAINLSSDIINTTNNISSFQGKSISLERIYSFMDIEPEKAYLEYCSKWSAKQEGYQHVITRGDIEFKNMSSRYREDLPDVLKDITVSIKAGEKIGIVGRTGAGKSSIINTLLRVTQLSKGQLLIDGQPIQSYLIKNLRYNVTMIDQEPTLIKSTFRQNLDIAHTYTDQELYQILEECNLYETIMEKGGLEAAVSNQSLSAGQKQLLCICRAFLKHSKIVLVDEATANIDVKNDAIIQKVIAEKFKDCTVLTIAHRLSTLTKSDKILVMENGQAVEFGSPAELQVKEGGWYRHMVQRNDKQFLI